VVAENRSEETNDENMSPKRQFWDNLKEKHPDALYLIRAGEVYRLYNEDAAKGADILGITMKKYPERGFSAFAEFPRTQLDSYLPKLVRAGERVAISEIELQDKRQDEQETHRGIHR
jgi:DNA mismatch repair ATPase MutS